MAGFTAHDSALVQRANLNIAAAVVASLGAGASDHLIGRVTDDVRASHSVTELASAGGMSVVMGAVETAIARNAETNRPFNATDSRAAQLAGQGTGTHHGWHGDGSAHGRYGLLSASRASREAANDGGGGEGSGGGSASRAGNSGGSYAVAGTGGEPAGAPFWGSSKGMMMTRTYANDNNMNWAPPDLMKMGRPALQAMKDSGLKGDGYHALHNPSGLNLSNATIVHGSSHYMKRFNLNHNEAGKAAAKLFQHPALNKDLRGEVKGATEQAEKASNEKEYQAAKERIGEVRGHIHKDAPGASKAADDWAEKYGAEKSAGLDAKAGASKNEAGAKKDDAVAKKDDAETKQKGAANDDTSAKMAELLKKRQAAASAPKPPGK